MKKLLIVLIFFVLIFPFCESKKHKEAEAFKDSVMAGYFDTTKIYTKLPVYYDTVTISDTDIICGCDLSCDTVILIKDSLINMQVQFNGMPLKP